MTIRRRALSRVAALLTAAALLAPHGALGAKKKRRRSAAPAPVPRPFDPNKVTFATADGVTLAATWIPVPGAPDAPAVLLVHEFSRDRREWTAVAPELNARGLATLAVDLRGHGESLRKGGAAVRLTPRLQNDPNAFPRDVEAACRWLRQRAPKVGMMGLSIGANLVVLATAARWADAGVALSAVADRTVPLAGSLPTARSTLFIASEEDPGRAASARQLYEAEEEPRKVIVVPGAAHNLALFGEHPETKSEAYAWLAERLGALPPPAPTPTP